MRDATVNKNNTTTRVHRRGSCDFLAINEQASEREKIGEYDQSRVVIAYKPFPQSRCSIEVDYR